MSGCKPHPEAFIDIDEIAVHVGQDQPTASLTIFVGPSKEAGSFPASGTPAKNIRDAIREYLAAVEELSADSEHREMVLQR